MRFRNQAVEVGEQFDDAGNRYELERVEHPATPNGIGHAWAIAVTPRC